MSSFWVDINPFMREIQGTGDVSDVQAGGSLADLDVKTVTQSAAADFEAERLAELEQKQKEAEEAARAAAYAAAKAKAAQAAAEATAQGQANVAATNAESSSGFLPELPWWAWAVAAAVAWKVLGPKS